MSLQNETCAGAAVTAAMVENIEAVRNLIKSIARTKSPLMGDMTFLALDTLQ